MAVDRSKVTLHRSFREADDGGFMAGTARQRIEEVWELTKDAYAFFPGGRQDVERRLQRHVAVLIRGKC